MQNLDLVSTQRMEYVECKQRAGNKVDSFSIYITLLKLMTLDTVIPAWTKKQAN